MTPKEPKEPKAPKPAKSRVVLFALWLYVLALLGGLAALLTPVVGPLAIIVALVAVGFSVLSLREDM